MINFSGTYSDTEIDISFSYQVIKCMSLLISIVIWFTYSGFLITILTLSIVKVPFEDLETLSKSTYV